MQKFLIRTNELCTKIKYEHTLKGNEIFRFFNQVILYLLVLAFKGIRSKLHTLINSSRHAKFSYPSPRFYAELLKTVYQLSMPKICLIFPKIIFFSEYWNSNLNWLYYLPIGAIKWSRVGLRNMTVMYDIQVPNAFQKPVSRRYSFIRIF